MCSMKLISLKRMLFLVLPWNCFWLKELQRASLFHNVHAAHSWAWSSYFLPLLSLSLLFSVTCLSPSLVHPSPPLSYNLKTCLDPYHTPSEIVNISADFFFCFFFGGWGGGWWKAITLNSQCQCLWFLVGITYAFVFIFLRLYFCLDLALLEQKGFLICRIVRSLLLIYSDLVWQYI